MNNQETFKSVKFHNYKAFRNYSISLERFNILVGPNNAGKSTILGVFRILSEAIRKARARNPTLIQGPHGETRGYQIDLDSTLVATENVFHDYDDSEPATVTFKLGNGNELVLYFPEREACYLMCKTLGKQVTTTAAFASQFNVSIGFVPILGPVDPEELLYQKEAARLALLTHRAARNFRNIWHHYPEDFQDFRELIQTTWPGMDIDRPEVDLSHDKPLLRMFCPEERIPREIYWAGFGFQVWCQMLTYILRSKSASLFIIDEPDIYLHSDLQRQLLGILKTLGPSILIATHSTEIISEAEPNDLLVINKKYNSAKRIKDPAQLQEVFGALGSNLNPILTQLAKTKRALFVEGDDFQIFSRFARRLGIERVANRADFAVIPAKGFNPIKVRNFIEGVERTLGTTILTAVVFDRDYRSAEEANDEVADLLTSAEWVHIHSRKELENFLLIPSAINRAIQTRLAERNGRNKTEETFTEDVGELLRKLTEPLKHKVFGQVLARRRAYIKSKTPKIDESTIIESLMPEFENLWDQNSTRFELVSGKEVLATLNTHLQETYHLTISNPLVVNSFKTSEIPTEMIQLIENMDAFGQRPPLSSASAD